MSPAAKECASRMGQPAWGPERPGAAVHDCWRVPVGEGDAALYRLTWVEDEHNMELGEATVVQAGNLAAGFPHFRVVPRHGRVAPAGAWHESELSLESIEFSQQFRLLAARTGDQAALLRLFDPETIVWFIGEGETMAAVSVRPGHAGDGLAVPLHHRHRVRRAAGPVAAPGRPDPGRGHAAPAEHRAAGLGWTGTPRRPHAPQHRGRALVLQALQVRARAATDRCNPVGVGVTMTVLAATSRSRHRHRRNARARLPVLRSALAARVVPAPSAYNPTAHEPREPTKQWLPC